MSIHREEIRRIVVVGDAYVSPGVLAQAAQKLLGQQTEIIPLLWGSGDKNEFTDQAALIERDGPDAVPYPQGLDDEIESADLLMVHFCPLPRRLLERAKRLKLAGICRGGVENIAVDALTGRRVPLIHIIRNAEAVAEFTLGLMLSETRNIARSHRRIMEGQWPTQFSNSGYTSTLKNLTVGLVGLGNIGMLVMEKLTALGIPVMGFDPFLPDRQAARLPIPIAPSLEALFSQADVVSLHLRLTERNRNLVDSRLLALMKPTAYLVNVSRGGLINEADLFSALHDHRIAGAALDVFADEPPVPGCPLLGLDNVTLTPHIAGDTVDSIERSPYLLCEKIEEFLRTGGTGWVYNKNSL